MPADWGHLRRSAIAALGLSALTFALIVSLDVHARLMWFIPVMDVVRAAACVVVAVVALLDASTRRDPRALPQVVVGTCLAVLFFAHFLAFHGAIPGISGPTASNTDGWFFEAFSFALPCLLTWAVVTRPRPIINARRVALRQVTVGIALGLLGVGSSIALGASSLVTVSGDMFTTVTQVVTVVVLLPVAVALIAVFRGRGDARVAASVVAALVFICIQSLIEVYAAARYTPVWYGEQFLLTFATLALLSGTFSLYAGSVRAELASVRSLAESNLRLTALVESAPDATVVVDELGEIVLVNGQLERLSGYTREELLGQTVELLIPQRLRGGHEIRRGEFFAHPAARAMGAGLELFALRKDGCELPVEISLSQVESDGRMLVSGAIRDITARLEAEAMMRLQSVIAEHMAEGVVLVRTADWTIAYANPKFEQMFGYGPGELDNEPVEVINAATEGEPLEVAAAIMGELETTSDSSYEVRNVRKDGTPFWSQASATTFDHPRLGRVVIAIHTDVTERKRIEDVNQRLAAIVEQSDDAILSESPDGTITSWNSGAERLYGYSSQEAVGMSIRTLVPDDVRTDEELTGQHVIARGLAEPYETVRMRKDGSRVDVSLAVSPIRDAHGDVVSVSTIARDITERKRFEGQLQYLVDHDPLTGLFNRRRFEEELTRELARARRYRTGGAVLAVDLDHFKYINDSLGHSAGDELITQCSEIFGRRLRETDVLARLGGDEFAVLLPGADEYQARVVANDLVEAIRTEGTVDSPGGLWRVTASIGIALFEDDRGLTGEELLVEADIAMYDAKEAGRDRALVYSRSEDHHPRMQARITWGERIRQALADDKFVLFAQPILALDGDTAPRHELLVRMVGDDGELIAPGAFLAVAERMDLIQGIDRWVLHEGIKLLACEQRAGTDIRLELNLSPRSITDPELPDLIAQELQEVEADARGLCLEITETAAIVNVDRAKRFAAQLAELGCEFALDDFGAGFASFYYLKHMAFDYVKIDGEFIENLATSHTDQLVVRSLVEIARGLGKRTIAEFVADRDTLALLRDYGVDYAQGFYVGKPKPLAEIDLAQAPVARV